MKYLAIIALVPMGSLVNAQPRYEYIELSTTYRKPITVVGINNRGVVAGHVLLAWNDIRAFTIDNGEFKLLPRFLGIHPWQAIAINDNGDVIGGGAFGYPHYSSVLYRDGKVINIPMPGNSYNGLPAVTALNNRGDVLGNLYSGIAIWNNGEIKLIPGHGGGVAINDDRVIAGSMDQSATKWIGGLPLILHPAWAESSTAVDVNSHGDVIGYAHIPLVATRGLLWKGRSAIDLGHLGWSYTKPQAINDHCQIVGRSQDISLAIKGVLWDKGRLYRLEDLLPRGHGLTIWRAEDINNAGQIIATGGRTGMNQQKWFLLNPVR